MLKYKSQVIGDKGKVQKKVLFCEPAVHFGLNPPPPSLPKSEPPYFVCFSSGPIVTLKKFTDSLGHYLYITIGIIWSLAAKGRFIKKIPVFWQKKKKIRK